MINSLSNTEKLEQFILWSHRGNRIPRCAQVFFFDFSADNVMLLTDDEALEIDKKIKELMKSYYRETRDWRTPEEWKKIRLQFASFTDRAMQLHSDLAIYKTKINKFENYLLENL